MNTPLPGDNREDADFEGVGPELEAERTAEFRTLLFEERKRLMKNAKNPHRRNDVDQDDLPDEMDLATRLQPKSVIQTPGVNATFSAKSMVRLSVSRAMNTGGALIATRGLDIGVYERAQ